MPFQELILRPAGLWTNASAFGSTPAGALAEADNVVIRRKGVAEPRPGFSGTSTVDLVSVHALLGYPGQEKLVVGEPNVGNDTTWQGAGEITDEDNNPLVWERGRIFGAPVRKNLYLTTSDALRRLSSPHENFARKVGAPPLVIAIVDDPSTSATLAPTNTFYSYRAVKLRTDPNGMVVRSAPSNRVVYGNTTATTRDITIRVFGHEFDDNDPAIEQWEIYRSVAAPTAAGVLDEHYLVKRFGPKASDSNATEAFTDNVPDSELGQPLYTNDDEEGLDNANRRPPMAKAAAEFNGSLVLGDLTFPAYQTVQYSYTQSLTAATNAGIGSRSVSGTFTNGSAVVTGIADTTGLRVGMIVVDTVGEWNNGGEYVRIVSKTANSVTMNVTYSGATGAKSRFYRDSIRVNARYFPVQNQFELGNITFWNDFNDAGEVFEASADVYAFSEDTAYYTRGGSGVTNSGPVVRTLTLEAILPTSTPFEVWATHGDEYDPPLPEPSVADGQEASQDVFHSGVLWSKTREPEHFSFVDLEQLGGDDAEVWNLCRGGDGLWVLKEDGMFRMSGADRNSGFRFDRVSSARVLHPNAAVESGDRAFAWCDQGLMSLTSGVTEIPSLAIADRLREVQAFMPSVENYPVWISHNLRTNEIVLSRPDLVDGEMSPLGVHVLNLETDTWVEWDLLSFPSCGLYDSEAGQLHFGLEEAAIVNTPSGTNVFMVLSEVSALHAVPHHDKSYTFTCTVVGTAVTITGGGWVPVVGDVVEIVAGDLFTVTAVADATHFTVDAVGVTSPANAYQGFASLITTVAQTAKNPGLIKLWGDGSLLFGTLEEVQSIAMTFSAPSGLTAAYTSGPLADSVQGRGVRFIVPRATSRAELLIVSLTLGGAAYTWRLEGMNLFYKIMSQRVRS